MMKNDISYRIRSLLCVVCMLHVTNIGVSSLGTYAHSVYAQPYGTLYFTR